MNTKNTLILTILALTTFGNSVQADLSSWFRTSPSMSWVTAPTVAGIGFGLLASYTAVLAKRNIPALRRKAEYAQVTSNMLQYDINKVAKNQPSQNKHQHLPSGILSDYAIEKIDKKYDEYKTSLSTYAEINEDLNEDDKIEYKDGIDNIAQEYDDVLVEMKKKAITVRRKANAKRYAWYAAPALFASASALCFYFGNRR